MQVKIEKAFQVDEPIDRVWAFLSDPTKVVTCVPGAQITEAVDEKTYKGTVSVKVGPSVTDYKGEVRIEHLDDQSHEIALVGKGQDVRGRGSATMKMTGRLRALDGGGTEVVSVSELSVVGVLAQFGARMINDVSNKIFEEFTKSFQQQLHQARGPEEAEPATPAEPPRPISAVPLVMSAVWAAIVGFFRRIFRGPAGL